MAVEAVDGTPVTRLSDFRRLHQQLSAIDRAQRTLAAKVAALEATAADVRSDLIAGREVDEEIAKVLDGLLADMASCRR